MDLCGISEPSLFAIELLQAFLSICLLLENIQVHGTSLLILIKRSPEVISSKGPWMGPERLNSAGNIIRVH